MIIVYKWYLNECFFKSILMVFILLTLSGCDAAYKSSSVLDDANLDVLIIPITPETVLEANSSPYDPLKLPGIISTVDENSEQSIKLSKSLKPTLGPQRELNKIEGLLPKVHQQQPYIIGVGDVVTMSRPNPTNVVEALNGLNASEFRKGYTVQDDGAVSIPDIGRIVIAGLTLKEAEDIIYQYLVEVGLALSFSIEVAEFNSKKVYVLGEVESPGIVPITLQPLYLDEVISRRGGVKISDTSFVYISLYRDGSIYQISLKELYNQNNLLKILLKDDDRIVVETTAEYDNALGIRQKARALSYQEKYWITEASENASQSVKMKLQYGAIPRENVYVIGEVGKQTKFTLPFEDRAVLADALLASDGVAPLSGNPNQIYLLRGVANQGDLTSVMAFHLDATNAANFLLATQLELRPKDVIFVGAQPITNWNRMLNQILPSIQLSRN